MKNQLLFVALLGIVAGGQINGQSNNVDIQKWIRGLAPSNGISYNAQEKKGLVYLGQYLYYSIQYDQAMQEYLPQYFQKGNSQAYLACPAGPAIDAAYKAGTAEYPAVASAVYKAHKAASQAGYEAGSASQAYQDAADQDAADQAYGEAFNAKNQEVYEQYYIALYNKILKPQGLTKSGAAGTTGPCLPAPVNGKVPSLCPEPSACDDAGVDPVVEVLQNFPF